MEDFVRKTKGVRDITSLPLDTSHELDIVSDVKGKIYIKILNRYKELLFDNGTEQWVIDMLNNLEVDVEQLKEDILDLEQTLSELPIIEDKLETAETTLAQINTLFAQMQIDVRGLDLRTAELEREVVQLALKDQELLDKINNLDLNVDLDILYSNSTEFGDYDYSGNPNLSAKLNASSFSSGKGATVTDEGDEIVFTLDGNSKLTKYKIGSQTPLIHGKTYTMSCEILLESDFVGDASNIKLQHSFLPGGYVVLQTTTIPSNTLNVWQRLQGTITSNYGSGKPEQWYSVFTNIGSNTITGNIRLRNVKIEEGSTATPYQPNLLDAPYYLSKTPLGENIADPKKVFPIKTSSYNIYQGRNTENYQLNQTYTITMKATKASTQQFAVYLAAGRVGVGNMQPVEGLTDVWKLTFKVTQAHLDDDITNILDIYQFPNTSLGEVAIDWIKLEKGDTRTPNIPYYKYVGINPVASKNPNDYQWIPLAKSAETVDARLTKTISTYDTVNALQNNRLTALESKVVDTTWQNVTVTEPFTSVTQPQVKKQSGIVYMRGTISNGTGDCFTLPEGFRPPEGAYEMQFRLPCRSTDAADYATMYVRPSGLCSIAGVNGTKPIFLSGIIFSTT